MQKVGNTHFFAQQPYDGPNFTQIAGDSTNLSQHRLNLGMLDNLALLSQD